MSIRPSSSTRTIPPGTPTGASWAWATAGASRQAKAPSRLTLSPKHPPESGGVAREVPIRGSPKFAGSGGHWKRGGAGGGILRVRPPGWRNW